MNNSLKHAHANAVGVKLFRDGQTVIFEIMDDGCGFEPEMAMDSGMGLNNMRNRAAEIGAELDIITHPGDGTVIRVALNEGEL